MMLVVYSSNVGQQMQGKGLFCPPATSSKFYSQDFVRDTNTVQVCYEALHSQCSLLRHRFCKFTVVGTEQ